MLIRGTSVIFPVSHSIITLEQHGRGVLIAADHEEAKQIALTIQFIKETNASHKPYLSHLCKSYLDGLDVYPNTVQEAYNTLQ